VPPGGAAPDVVVQPMLTRLRPGSRTEWVPAPEPHENFRTTTTSNQAVGIRIGDENSPDIRNDGYYEGNNSVRVAFDMDLSMGSGDVKIVLSYMGEYGGAWDEPESSLTTVTKFFRQDQLTMDSAGKWNALLSWTNQAPYQDTVESLQLYKKDFEGVWHLVSSAGANTPFDTELGASATVGGPYVTLPAGAAFKYRLAGATDFTSPIAINFGDTFGFDMAQLTDGTYDYAIEAAGGPVRSGQFTVTGASAGEPVVTFAVAGGGTTPVEPGTVAQVLTREVFQRNDRWGNVIEITDARNEDWSTRYTYNRQNLLIQTDAIRAVYGADLPGLGLPPPERSVNATSLGTLYYDGLGRKIGSRDAMGYLSRQFYERHGMLGAEIDAEGGLRFSTFNLFGERTSLTQQVTGGANVVTQYAYDLLGRVTRSEIADVEYHNIADTTGGSGMNPHGAKYFTMAQKFRYDQMGRRIEVTNSAGASSRTRFDLDGNVVAVGDELGITIKYSYDAFHRKLLEVDAAGKALSPNTPTWPRTLLPTATTDWGAKSRRPLHRVATKVCRKTWRTSTTKPGC
jgi:YD repeat-containing protein